MATVKLLDSPEAPTVTLHTKSLSKTEAHKFDVVIQLVGSQRNRIPFHAEFTAARLRQDIQRNEPVVFALSNGTQVLQVPLQTGDRFTTQCSLRKGLELVKPKADARIVLDIRRIPRQRVQMQTALYSTLVYQAPMPSFGKRKKKVKAGTIDVYGVVGRLFTEVPATCADANILTRWLCIQPGNVLDPDSFVRFSKKIAEENELEFEHINCAKLAAKGAGAFVAVSGAKGKGGMVRISYRRIRARKHVALIGKGVCFDTGGINVKPHRHMLGMQSDMAGAAAALSAIIAARKMHLNLNIDVWLLLAENLVSAESMKPGDILTSLSGTTIELVHTDAEGRLMLADGLSMAAKLKPDILCTLATLTGSMAVALGNGISGVACDKLQLESVMHASHESGERLDRFPTPSDYGAKLDSKVADIRQCAVEGEADHILAALFLKRFNGKIPLIHMDMSASSCENGLGAVPTEQTGFGASWAVNWLQDQARR